MFNNVVINIRAMPPCVTACFYLSPSLLKAVILFQKSTEKIASCTQTAVLEKQTATVSIFYPICSIFPLGLSAEFFFFLLRV